MNGGLVPAPYPDGRRFQDTGGFKHSLKARHLAFRRAIIRAISGNAKSPVQSYAPNLPRKIKVAGRHMNIPAPFDPIQPGLRRQLNNFRRCEPAKCD